MLGFGSKKLKQRASIGSAPTFSYYRSSSPVVTPRKDKNPKNSPSWLKFLPSLIAIVACLGLVVYNLYISPGASVQAEGQNLYRPFEAYQRGINDILGSSILNRIKITFNSESIEQKILEAFPELSNVTVAVPLVGHDPVVGIRFAEPRLKFMSDGKQMLLDVSGKVLPLEDVAANLPTVTDESNISYKIGDRALTRQEVAAISSTASEVNANSRKILSVKIGTAPKEFNIQLEGEDYFVKLSFEYPIKQQLGALWAVLERLGNDKPKSYIDVRLGERVFVL